ncbi:MAG: TMEM175 family protein [Actinomycetota bacterium]|nr:TMEM175 family protein [Actinomycetota bacterium]
MSTSECFRKGWHSVGVDNAPAIDPIVDEGPGRLTWFGDGVLAVIATIMACDLKPPAGYILISSSHRFPWLLIYLLRFTTTLSIGIIAVTYYVRQSLLVKQLCGPIASPFLTVVNPALQLSAGSSHIPLGYLTRRSSSYLPT